MENEFLVLLLKLLTKPQVKAATKDGNTICIAMVELQKDQVKMLWNGEHPLTIQIVAKKSDLIERFSKYETNDEIYVMISYALDTNYSVKDWRIFKDLSSTPTLIIEEFSNLKGVIKG